MLGKLAQKVGHSDADGLSQYHLQSWLILTLCMDKHCTTHFLSVPNNGITVRKRESPHKKCANMIIPANLHILPVCRDKRRKKHNRTSVA